MGPVEPFLQIAVAAGLIVLNAGFVLVEFALVRVRSSRLELLARQGNARAILVQGMLRDLDLYLSAIQMGITMASLGLGWIGEPAVAGLLEGRIRGLPLGLSEAAAYGLSFALAFGFITVLHILLGELVPRSVGLQKAELVTLWAAYPLRVFYLAFKTPVTLMARASIAILRLMRLQPASEAETHLSEEEIRLMLGASEERGGVPLERLLLIENIFDFGSAKVADIMVPREKVACLALSKGWEENLEVIRTRRFSRYPLCEGGLDSVVGMVHLKDSALAGFSGGVPDLRKLRRDLAEVPAGESLQKLLQQFADRGIHMALVRGGDGAAAGVVTLEDILEELVGEVHDEFDLPQAWSLMDVVVPSAVEAGVEAADREAVIRRLVGRLHAARPEFDAEEAVRAVLERESKLSSAIGHGVAVPHGRLASLRRALVAVALASRALPFPAPDKHPVRLVFLVLSPSAVPLAQLRILGRIASLLSNDNLRRRLLRAQSARRLLDVLGTADTLVAA